MNFPRIIFLLVLLVSFFFVGYLVTTFAKLPFFSWDGYFFITFGIFGSFIYFTERYLRFFDSLISVFFLSVLNSYFLSKSSFGKVIPNIFLLFLYSLILYSLIFATFKIIWNKKNLRAFRNILFSIAAAICFTLIQIITHKFTNLKITGEYIYIYFKDGMIYWLTISFSFTIAEYFFSKLENIWKLPDRIIPKENEKEED